MSSIGENVKIAREEAKLSQLQVAVSLGVSDKTISGYESNRISPPIEKLQKLSELLKKPVAYFIGSDPRTYKVASRLRAVELMLRDIRRELREIKALAQTINLDV
jgi:transcriptional regulator with XRE-family HTH domain